MFSLHFDVIKSWYSVLLDDCCDKFRILINKAYLQKWHVEEEIIYLSFILYVTVRSAWETSTHSKTNYSQTVGVIKVLRNESSNRTSDILWHILCKIWMFHFSAWSLLHLLCLWTKRQNFETWWVQVFTICCTWWPFMYLLPLSAICFGNLAAETKKISSWIFLMALPLVC